MDNSHELEDEQFEIPQDSVIESAPTVITITKASDLTKAVQMRVGGETAEQVIDSTIQLVRDFKTGVTEPIKTRFTKLNEILEGGIYLAENYLICGLSGGGKTSFINKLREDLSVFKFKDPSKIAPLVLMFYYEAGPEQDLLKSVQSNLGMTRKEILAKLPDKEDITELVRIEEAIKCSVTHNILYFKEAMTPSKMRDTLEKTYSITRGRFPIIAMHDHTNLYKSEKDSDNKLALIEKLSDICMETKKKFGVTNILLSQLNTEITSPMRISAPSQHAPRMGDIFGGKSIFHAMEVVMVLHVPANLGIASYTERQLDTRNRSFVHVIKNRYGACGFSILDTSRINHNILTEIDYAP